MRKKNWVLPGILMLAVLLLLSFPVIALAQDNVSQDVSTTSAATDQNSTVTSTDTNQNSAVTSADRKSASEVSLNDQKQTTDNNQAEATKSTDSGTTLLSGSGSTSSNNAPESISSEPQDSQSKSNLSSASEPNKADAEDSSTSKSNDNSLASPASEPVQTAATDSGESNIANNTANNTASVSASTSETEQTTPVLLPVTGKTGSTDTSVIQTSEQSGTDSLSPLPKEPSAKESTGENIGDENDSKCLRPYKPVSKVPDYLPIQRYPERESKPKEVKSSVFELPQSNLKAQDKSVSGTSNIVYEGSKKSNALLENTSDKNVSNRSSVQVINETVSNDDSANEIVSNDNTANGTVANSYTANETVSNDIVNSKTVSNNNAGNETVSNVFGHVNDVPETVDNSSKNDATKVALNNSSSNTVSKLPLVNYLVRKGESLWLIGRSFGVDFVEIMKANHLINYLIYPDQKLAIPGVDIKDGQMGYRIKKGDSFYLIGKALGIDFKDIMALNGAKDIWIYPNQSLNVPDGSNTKASVLNAGVIKPNVVIAALGSDLELLARAIYAEARGESYEGQVAVGAVIMNRLKASMFPKTIKDIIFQPGAFTSVDDGQINLSPDEQSFKAAQDALNGADPTLGAIYYWNPDVATSKWIWTRPIIKQIGKHVFAR